DQQSTESRKGSGPGLYAAGSRVPAACRRALRLLPGEAAGSLLRPAARTGTDAVPGEAGSARRCVGVYDVSPDVPLSRLWARAVSRPRRGGQSKPAPTSTTPDPITADDVGFCPDASGPCVPPVRRGQSWIPGSSPQD